MHKNHLTLRGGGCNELRSCHCTLAWVAEWDSILENKNKTKKINKIKIKIFCRDGVWLCLPGWAPIPGLIRSSCFGLPECWDYRCQPPPNPQQWKPFILVVLLPYRLNEPNENWISTPQSLFLDKIKYTHYYYWNRVSLCLPGWSAVARSWLTATSTSWLQAILLPQPLE